MTVFGWGIVGVIAFSLYVSCKISRRISGAKIDPLILGFVLIILTCVNGLTYVFSFNYIENSYSLFFGNKYNAVVVDYQHSKGTTTPTGRISKAPQEIDIYTAIVEYKDKKGKCVNVKVNYGKDKPPKIGEIIVISDRLNEDSVNDVSSATSPIILFSYLFLSILMSISFFLSCYGFGIENHKNRKLTKTVFSACIIGGLFLYVMNFIISI